jgi:hypothetical protein
MHIGNTLIIIIIIIIIIILRACFNARSYKKSSYRVTTELTVRQKVKVQYFLCLIVHYTKRRCGKLNRNGGEWELYDLATLHLEKLFPMLH